MLVSIYEITVEEMILDGTYGNNENVVRPYVRYHKKYAFCPECGCRLLRVQSGICELECAKCKRTIVVKFEDGLLEIFKSRREKERVQ